MENMPDILTADRISKTFKLETGQIIKALESISFSVPHGGTTALVGPDGAGKSTLLRIIAGLLKPGAGTLLFEGEPLSGQRNTIGYMPQQFGLYEDLSVQENLDLYADLNGLNMREREDRYNELLSMCAMGPFRKRLAGNLSGGMKQKLGLICTLLYPPKLLLLDEPTVGVDPLSRHELWQIIQSLAGSSGMSVVMSTSYLDEASQCNNVVLLFEGKMLASGTPKSIMELTDGMGYLAVPSSGDTPRSLQACLLTAPFIIDAVPQGGGVRFVHENLNREQEATLSDILNGAAFDKTPPTLEDSFMLLLRRHTGIETEGSSTVPANRSELSAFGSHPQGGTNDEPAIQTRNVSRFFGNFAAVNDVSFTVNKGEVFGLLGPNGAGKTTTFRMLCGLLPASKGSLYVAGVNVREAREEARRHLGYVAQKFSLYGPLNTRENLDFFAGAYGLRGAHKEKRIKEVVEDFSLERYMNTPAEELPGGYKRRLAMAVGILHEPAILFLDEPTSGADPLARRDFWKRISRLADQGVTIVVTTHFMEEAEYCDRILIQDGGVMLAMDTPANIRAKALGATATMEDAFINIVREARKEKERMAT
jgi:ABC-2 type transport system ATP-binding protein